MKIQVETITPETAVRYLEGNTHNRRLKKDRVATYARDMQAGRWALNGESIKFNGSRLIDGQNRLHGCILANAPFATIVVRGLAAETFSTIDRNAIRSDGDVLGLMGEKNSRNLAAALKVVDRYLTGRIEAMVPRYSTGEVVELLNSHPSVRDSMQATKGVRKFIVPAYAAAGHYLFSRKDEEKANDFFGLLIRGNASEFGREKGVHLLRERLINIALDRRGKQSLSEIHIFALLILAWNGYYHEKEIGVLRWGKGQPFPTIR